MTVKFQLSDKRGDAILLVSAEDNDPGVAYQSFRIAAEDAGLNASIDAFGQPGVVAQGVNFAQALTGGQQYAAPAPAAAPVATPGAPTCPHGSMTRRTGTNARGAWVGYFCPSPKGTPDQCKARFE